MAKGTLIVIMAILLIIRSTLVVRATLVAGRSFAVGCLLVVIVIRATASSAVL